MAAAILACRLATTPSIEHTDAPRLVCRWRIGPDGRLVCSWRQDEGRRAAGNVVPMMRPRREVRHGGL